MKTLEQQQLIVTHEQRSIIHKSWCCHAIV
jgi:hypothetical protein